MYSNNKVKILLLMFSLTSLSVPAFSHCPRYRHHDCYPKDGYCRRNDACPERNYDRDYNEEYCRNRSIERQEQQKKIDRLEQRVIYLQKQLDQLGKKEQ